jgi:hypothetical protein
MVRYRRALSSVGMTNPLHHEPDRQTPVFRVPNWGLRVKFGGGLRVASKRICTKVSASLVWVVVVVKNKPQERHLTIALLLVGLSLVRRAATKLSEKNFGAVSCMTNRTSTVEHASTKTPVPVALVRLGAPPASFAQYLRGRFIESEVPLTPEHGDLLVVNRSSSYQKLLIVSGEPGVHAAIVVRIDGTFFTVEVGPVGVFCRPYEEFCSKYRSVGILRPLLSQACRDAVAAEALRQLGERTIRYSPGLCVVIGVGGLARRVLPTRAEPFVDRAALVVAQALSTLLGPSKMTCSSFVASCLAVACPTCRPVLEWPVRSRVKPWRGMPTLTDLVRGPLRRRDERLRSGVMALTSPTDLWAAVRAEYRAVITAGVTTALFDSSASTHAETQAKCQAHQLSTHRKEAS